jgi:N-acetyl-anhydromuramyl-L-alanine amidase AmpD
MPSLDILTRGDSFLEGPRANLGLGRDGTYYAIAAGKAWHAGIGAWDGIPSGNSNTIGIEAENTGYTKGERAESWPPDQMEAYKKG